MSKKPYDPCDACSDNDFEMCERDGECLGEILDELHTRAETAEARLAAVLALFEDPKRMANFLRCAQIAFLNENRGDGDWKYIAERLRAEVVRLATGADAGGKGQA